MRRKHDRDRKTERKVWMGKERSNLRDMEKEGNYSPGRRRKRKVTNLTVYDLV